MNREPPATLWLRQSSTENKRFYETLFSDEPDAIQYIRADLHEITRAVIQSALDDLDSNNPEAAAMILRQFMRAQPQ